MNKYIQEPWHKKIRDEDALKYMIGKTYKDIKNDEESLLFIGDDHDILFEHRQDCCEQVYLEDVVGELEWLIDSPILYSEVVDGVEYEPECAESYTWTFYKISTIKGSVTLRWLGQSNGYYSESVDVVVEKYNTNECV